MKYRLSKLICFCLVGMLTGCGLIDMEFDPITQQIISMQFNYDTVYVMKGDTFFLAPYIYPDTVSNTTMYMKSFDEQVVGVQNDTIFAAEEGTTQVVAVSVSHGLADTCTVIVLSRWDDILERKREFSNDMVVYAHILVDGFAPGSKMIFGAFCDDEVRGLAEPMKDDRSLYRFRIWSDEFHVSGDDPGTEEITFRGYNPRTLQMTTTNSLKIRFDGESHGTPSKPLELTFKEYAPVNKEE
ncbi:MAG: hypothetical protein K5945_10045 [Bacteroidaceae bacterium]|nr:hypothetical protein [Bacteroidaceae bacterium]